MSMQRSLSSPVRTQSTPPPPLASPTEANVQPLATASIDTLTKQHRAGRYRSPSPKPSSRNLEARPSRRNDAALRPTRLQDGPQAAKPLLTDTTATALPPAATRLPQELPMRSHTIHGERLAARIPRPLIENVALYTNQHVPMPRDTTTLQELAHLTRLSKYQARKRNITRVRLERTLISTAVGARLTRCGDIAHRNLVDSFRKDEKDSFASLYNAIHDVRKSCDELRRFALLEPDLESQSSPILGSSESVDTISALPNGEAPFRPASTFFDDISVPSRDSFLDFISEIRNNPDYLPMRMSALSSSELNVFLNPHRGLEPVESILSSSGNRSHSRNHPSHHRHVAGDVERFMSFQRHDPLSILIHTCFANSAGPDSSEDRKRVDVWASVLAKLILEPKPSSEHFLICVLNCWTMMREWSGKSNMEWYLMKILSDGAFLLERAEDQHGTRFNLSDWTQTDEIAAREFYDNAVTQLLEIVDDPDNTGIPDGLLELGNAVLKKLDSKYLDNTSKWLVWRCLFFVFFLGVIVHPESHGMLTEHHITPYAREKILKKVAMKANGYVSGIWSGGKPAANTSDIPQHIRVHIESILARFQNSDYKPPNSRLLPAKSITSLRETAEVHPYLVLCPADLHCLINALYPERRPLSSASSTFKSGITSISGHSSASQPVAFSNPRNSFETASVISTSVSSVFSEAGPRDGHGDGSAKTTSVRDSPTITEPDLQRKLNKYEEDGYPLRLALHELTRNLGPDIVRGSSHPCAERWAVLFVSPDGKKLTTTLSCDADDDRDEPNSSSSDYDNESIPTSDLDKGYYQLRDAVLKLVEEYEIPRGLEAEASGNEISNRPSRIKRPTPRRTTRREKLAPEPTGGVSLRRSHSPDTAPHPSPNTTEPEKEAPLITMLKAAWSQSKVQADFVSSHMYWKTLNQLRGLNSESLRRNGYAALINIFAREPRDDISKSALAIEEYEAWLVWLKQSQERLEGQIDLMMRRTRAIRDKMWYIADVRNSKEYEHSRDICQALRVMGATSRWRSSTSRSGKTSSYINKAESQVLDMIAASPDTGGPNKLSDEQADMTSAWLKKYGIENFCQGEERIHRFCCEVEKCVSKLVGETIREAPVLWSSELYKRDKAMYDRMKLRERDSGWTSDDTGSIMSDNERRQTFSTLRPLAFGRDLRSVSSQNASLESVRHGFARHAASLSEVLDGHDGFERYSPVHNTDSGNTFWSPFQPPRSPASNRAYSPTTSLTNLSATFTGSPNPAAMASHSSLSTGRPATATSSNETVYQHAADGDRATFLSELRQSLTSLLLSDLGSQLLSKGSETDMWVAQLGQECIDRREALEQHAQRKKALKEKPSRSSTKPRVIEKKKSFGNLRGAGESALERMDGVDSSSSPSTSSFLTQTEDSQPGRPRDNDSEFPFKNAYRRLLTMFSVHPNPYAKLHALKELEHLLVASIPTSQRKRSRWRLEVATGQETREKAHRRTTLDGAINSVQEKRMQHTGNQSLYGAGGGSRGTSGTDTTISELMKLFRDPSMRPKHLFRDLQLISSFVSPTVLDRPERSKAFWDVGLAALKLKSEVCRTMVEMADEVFAAHTQMRGSVIDTTSGGVPVQSCTGTPPPPSSTYKLKDVGRMWAITAREGYPTAQRELALFYLSNPEFVERITLPLSKPREVFKQAVIDKYKRNEKRSSGAGAQGAGAGLGAGSQATSKDSDVRNDPGLMCVAVHWMEAAERGGDELATSFLRQNEFMGRG
ncbi:hypothetical protein ISF_01434 [Cordyceps fumosorosea ARSEF 2679]|uniref:Uncharacterized protein n=1 Tax=Cordyceps fumosorosea (strain ARSEF 2679) TaxID=1081104 RepID=A0A168DAH7_CORFA|nr:hypothetical protein ISF_01434 [Cordyceps fumosorosea ARSEF 2679]OAA72361.1 hypothetical protein ISF_01434 [Cordyceps fumosorosea ARSEF 2679]